GAVYTCTLESMMPDGRAVQMGTSHHLGQNFSKPFEIRFLGEDSELHFVWQTSWGISWRLIGAAIMEHGDDRGLILPPKAAPIQVVIVPIIFSSAKAGDVMQRCNEVAGKLEQSGLRVRLDSRENYTPGWKFNEWELKGVPLRIEIGPRDVASNSLVLVRRDSGMKESAPVEKVVDAAKEALQKIHDSMWKKASERLASQTSDAESFEELEKIMATEGGFVRAPWCGSEECEVKVKNDTGADIRFLPLEEKPEAGSVCVVCKRTPSEIAYFARAY
ncbi:MAG: His/Gly/Thr/Pro-type tRNA ligase C-terminal domain-containing protein, partial [Thaumarchaeota archaeon]|nr:His/Gly/Thr/Pro-type tRNA ligase C-terminal domain-containing protein [Nitrososphaerota archaeon]